MATKAKSSQTEQPANTRTTETGSQTLPASGRIEYDPDRMQGPRLGVVADPNAGGQSGGQQVTTTQQEVTPTDQRQVLPNSGVLGPLPVEPVQQVQPEPEPEPDPEPEPGPSTDSGEPTRVLTQAELDAIIEGRLKRERSKYSDYDDLKKRVEEIDGQTKSDAERQMAEIERLRRERDEVVQRNRNLEIQQAIGSEASRIGLDMKAAVKLADLDQLEFDPDTGFPLNAREVVDQVVRDFPQLVRGTRPAPQQKPANPDRSQQIPGRTDEDRRRDYFGGRTGTFWQGGGVIQSAGRET